MSFSKWIKICKQRDKERRDEYLELLQSLSTKELLILGIMKGDFNDYDLNSCIKRVKKFKERIK